MVELERYSSVKAIAELFYWDIDNRREEIYGYLTFELDVHTYEWYCISTDTKILEQMVGWTLEQVVLWSNNHCISISFKTTQPRETR